MSSLSPIKMSRSSVSTSIAVGVGVAIGLVIPVVYQRIFGKCLKDAKTKNESSAHAVRVGLSDDNDNTTIRINRDKLNDFVADILIKGAGGSQDNARLVAHVLLYADARGIPSHGANRTDTYVNEIRAGLVNATAVPIVEKRDGCCAVVHGMNGLGAVTSKLAMTVGLELVETFGVAVVTCHSSNHYGAAGYWAKIALDKGYMGMSFTNTSPIAVPTRSSVRGLGTNPFCFMAPADNEGESFQLDMATTTVPIGKIEVMDRINKPVPVGWGLDRHGNDCTDGEEICKFGGLYPLGGAEETAGYKGYGLGMFVEILCSVLSGASVGPDIYPWTISRDGPLNYGHCFVLIDPNRFTPGFTRRLQDYLNRMRSLPGNPLVAGDPEREFERDAAEKGILLHAPVATTLKALASKYGVQVPGELKRLDETKSKSSLYE